MEKIEVTQKSDTYATLKVTIDGIVFHVDVVTRNGHFMVATSPDGDDVTMKMDHIHIDSHLNRAEFSPLVK